MNKEIPAYGIKEAKVVEATIEISNRGTFQDNVLEALALALNNNYNRFTIKDGQSIICEMARNELLDLIKLCKKINQ